MEKSEMKIWYNNEEIEVKRVCSKVTSYKKGGKKPFDVTYEPCERDLRTATDYCLSYLFDCDKSVTRIVGEVFVETETKRIPIRTFLIKWDKKGNRVCTMIEE